MTYHSTVLGKGWSPTDTVSKCYNALRLSDAFQSLDILCRSSIKAYDYSRCARVGARSAPRLGSAAVGGKSTGKRVRLAALHCTALVPTSSFLYAHCMHIHVLLRRQLLPFHQGKIVTNCLRGSQCPRTDLNKRFLPRPKTITA